MGPVGKKKSSLPYFESPSGYDLKCLLIEASLNKHSAAELFGISTRTVDRWFKKGCPRYAEITLNLLAGRLDYLGWQGWRIINGVLYTDQLKKGFLPEYIYRAFWNRQELLHLRKEIDRMSKQKTIEKADLIALKRHSA